MDTYIYQYNGKLYVNLTNKCTNNCKFCLRNNYNGVGGYDLRLGKEPDATYIIKLLKKCHNVANVIYCGLGEPTIRLDVLLETATYLRTRDAHIRLNTNGQGSAYAGNNIVGKLQGLVDTVSISLNASNAVLYQEACRSIYGEQAYTYLLDFAKCCIGQGIKTVLSVVDIIGKDEIEKCRRIAQEIGAKLRIRHYID